MTKLKPPREPMSLISKIGIGMLIGLLAPYVLGPLYGVILPYNRAYARHFLLFGPVFGGAMAYFLHRYRSAERQVGEYWWTILAGGLAGGLTASIAFDFGYLTQLWQVGLGFLGGAVLIAISRHL